MKQDNKLTKKALADIAALNITEKDILLVCPVDLSFEGKYIAGYAFLTDTKLGITTRAITEKHVEIFRGVKFQDDLTDEEFQDYETKLYDLKNLNKIHLEHYIGTNVLHIQL